MAKLYNHAITAAFNKQISLSADTIKCALATSSYVPNQATHAYFSDVTNEVVATGYTAGGITLTNKVQSFAGQIFEFDADNAAWAASFIVARFAIIYGWTGVASTSPLICYVDGGVDTQSSGGALSVLWDAGGVFQAIVS